MKKITVLALACLASSQTMAAGPDFYGRMWLAGTYSDSGLAGNEKVDGTSMESYASFIGLRGSEAITDSLKLLYKFEAGIETFDSDAGDVFKARNTYIGLDSNYGQVIFGRNDTVFKKTEGGIDKFNITSADMNRLISGNDRLADSITYYSPKLAGFKFGASYVLEDDFGGNAKLDDANNYAVSLIYGDGKLKTSDHYIGLAYADGLNGLEALRVTAGYKLDALRLGLLYQDSDSLKYDNLSGDSYLVSMDYRIGKKHLLKAQFGYDDAALGKLVKNAGADLGSVSDAETTNVTLGYDYKLTKALTLGGYAAYYDGEFTDESGKQDFDDTLVSVHAKYLF